jgi:RNA polymerase sigma-70 factor (sigma-E family)
VRSGVDFSEYVAARGEALERYAYVLTGDAHRAEDLVQTALLKAYRRWRRVSRADSPDAYVRRIVTTSYLDWRRRRSNAEEPAAVLVEQPGGPDPADRVAVRDELRRALATLSPRQRAVLVLRHYEGWTDAAIADVLRCGEPAVRTHASRGLQRLRAALDPTTQPEGSR